MSTEKTLSLDVVRAIISVALILVLTASPASLQAGEKSAALIEAAEQGDLGKVKRLLHSGANVNAKGPEGKTPLMVAAEKGHLEVVKLLLLKGAKVNR